MDILTLNSKVKIGCKICDKCCIYRGDIKITSINVCMISKFLKISPKEFVQKYTHEVERRISRNSFEWSRRKKNLYFK